MAYFESVEILGSLTPRVKKAKIDFKPGVNLIIGPNGTGKSTILQILKNNMSPALESKIVCQGKGDMYSFDFEKDNPRHRGAMHQEQSKFMGQLAALMSSHGQTVKAVLHLLTQPKVTGAAMLMDEPEQALDISGLQELIAALKNSPADQIIVATHSPFLILEPKFHIIEMADGYQELIRRAVKALV